LEGHPRKFHPLLEKGGHISTRTLPSGRKKSQVRSFKERRILLNGKKKKGDALSDYCVPSQPSRKTGRKFSSSTGNVEVSGRAENWRSTEKVRNAKMRISSLRRVASTSAIWKGNPPSAIERKVFWVRKGGEGVLGKGCVLWGSGCLGQL